MLVQYLFLVLFGNVPRAIGLAPVSYMYGPPKDPPQGHTCNCNCNFPKPMSYYDPYGQQAMVCIPVPITIQGMYPQNTGQPGYMSPGFPSDVRRPGYVGSPQGPSVPSDVGRPPYPVGYGTVPGGYGQVPSHQPALDVSGRPVAPHLLGNILEPHHLPAPSPAPYPGEFRVAGPGSGVSIGQPPEVTTISTSTV